MLLLEGYKPQGSTNATGRSERTARQHAVSVYRKAGLSGRAELAAFFREDLMLPDGAGSVTEVDALTVQPVTERT